MAVYTDITDQELALFISDYEIGTVVSYKGIAEGVENSNFLLQTTSGTYILTLYEKRVNPADLPFFVGIMEHLAAKGFACPTPIVAKDGKALRSLCGRPAAIVSFLQGVWPRRIENTHCFQLGAGMAQLHLLGSDFPGHRANDLSIMGWRKLAHSIGPHADDVRAGLMGELEADLDALEARWPSDLPSGVIHADLFPDNVFFLNNIFSGIIDFYFSCTDFFAYDIAICINAWCFESDGGLNITRAQHLLAGYKSVRPLKLEEIEALPLLCRGAAIRFLLTRLYDWVHTPAGAFVRRKDPLEYLQKVRFHRSVIGPDAYGLTL